MVQTVMSNEDCTSFRSDKRLHQNDAALDHFDVLDESVV